MLATLNFQCLKSKRKFHILQHKEILSKQATERQKKHMIQSVTEKTRIRNYTYKTIHLEHHLQKYVSAP